MDEALMGTIEGLKRIPNQALHKDLWLNTKILAEFPKCKT
jgi:hypothetical protein